mmetsp:Transcript_38888/g.98629  ORF Transcript_38888/g.98629 Transcript_38888/m.98629 type:complete len:81 (-) Transcript_38888:147-389(-)|eukprot:CAMPEP_0118829216 /NCGR_PEP_ID=MMETSP1162-20130426/22390_1 /TAXON_ID=33656 /ORGANISM="Phaeocystis Sp, Strain CCMP2710" /LENGTH=80 /DNA_ID=CAMNT_0006760353 /DNA_START=53 /DNA_END=295 /DNA_ORIENTATION=+
MSQAEGKNFLDKDATPEEMIKGLLGCMPMGARTAQYIPAEGVQALADGESSESKPDAFKGAYTVDESKWEMPEELKAKYA